MKFFHKFLTEEILYKTMQNKEKVSILEKCSLFREGFQKMRLK